MHISNCLFCRSEVHVVPKKDDLDYDGRGNPLEWTKLKCTGCGALMELPISKEEAIELYNDIEFEPVADKWPQQGDTVYIVYRSQIVGCEVFDVGPESLSVKVAGGLVDISKRGAHRTRQHAANSLV